MLSIFTLYGSPPPLVLLWLSHLSHALQLLLHCRCMQHALHWCRNVYICMSQHSGEAWQYTCTGNHKCQQSLNVVVIYLYVYIHNPSSMLYRVQLYILPLQSPDVLQRMSFHSLTLSAEKFWTCLAFATSGFCPGYAITICTLRLTVLSLRPVQSRSRFAH